MNPTYIPSPTRSLKTPSTPPKRPASRTGGLSAAKAGLRRKDLETSHAAASLCMSSTIPLHLQHDELPCELIRSLQTLQKSEVTPTGNSYDPSLYTDRGASDGQPSTANMTAQPSLQLLAGSESPRIAWQNTALMGLDPRLRPLDFLGAHSTPPHSYTQGDHMSSSGNVHGDSPAEARLPTSTICFWESASEDCLPNGKAADAAPTSSRRMKFDGEEDGAEGEIDEAVEFESDVEWDTDSSQVVADINESITVQVFRPRSAPAWVGAGVKTEGQHHSRRFSGTVEISDLTEIRPLTSSEPSMPAHSVHLGLSSVAAGQVLSVEKHPGHAEDPQRISKSFDGHLGPPTSSSAAASVEKSGARPTAEVNNKATFCASQSLCNTSEFQDRSRLADSTVADEPLENSKSMSLEGPLSFQTRNLLFDEVLNCYFDPVSGRFYEAEPDEPGSREER